MKKINVVDAFESNQECNISYKNPISSIRQYLDCISKIGDRRHPEGCRAKGTSLTILIILADDIEMYPGRTFSVSFAKTYWKAQDKIIECGDCEKGFHSTCAKLVAETISIF